MRSATPYDKGEYGRVNMLNPNENPISSASNDAFLIQSGSDSEDEEQQTRK